jgi:DNA polymerase
MRKLHLDFETKSRVNLKKVGTDVYVHDPSTAILMMAWAFDDDPVELWQPHLGPMPGQVVAALTDKTVTKHSWHVGFEFGMITVKLGIPLVYSQWRDPMAHSRYLAYPGDLDSAGLVLEVGTDHAKSKTGKALIKLFSEPTKAKKATKKNPAGVPSTFNDWMTHYDEWEMFCEYCKQDVVAEREIARKLDAVCPFPDSEQRIWRLDQSINDRGIPIDLDFAAKALALVEGERKVILGQMGAITGCANPNSPAQMKLWLYDKGFYSSSLDKEHVAEALKGKHLTPEAFQVLELKQLLGGIAFKKLPVIQRWTRLNRLRGAFTYHSAHTGRWASRGVQFHNLFRPSKRVAENYDAIVNAIKTGGPMPFEKDAEIAEAIAKGKPVPESRGQQIPIIEAVSGALRAAVHALPGNRLMVADFSSVENRVLGWIAKCPGILNVFLSLDSHGKPMDPYKSFAADFYKLDYDLITKQQRNFCKSPVLGCGFGMGAKRLVDYAAGMGQIISEAEAKELVDAWREMFPEVVEYWKTLGDVAMRAVWKKTCLQLGPLQIDGTDPRMLHIKLPSGRSLHYDQPEIGKDMYNRDVLVHMTETKIGWDQVQARGSSLVENVVQGIARDLLANGMFVVTKEGYKIVLHVHDELVTEVPYESPLTYAKFEECMTVVPEWAKGMPLKAEGFEGLYYKK